MNLNTTHFVNMSQVVKKNHSYLQFLVTCPVHQRKLLLETATPEQVHAIVQAVHNICRGYIPLTNRENEILLPFRDSIQDLEDPNIPYKKEKQILVQEGGSFVPDILIPFLSGLV